MCGIIAAAGEGDCLPELLDGLRRLEYRGYDSAGAALQTKNGVRIEKTAGNICALAQKLDVSQDFSGSVGIAHTRWATHGAPTDLNAHPHRSMRGIYTIVHNGILENNRAVRAQLEEDGYLFCTETDTETLVNFLEAQDTGNALQTLQRVCGHLQGSFAVCLLDSRDPEAFYCLRIASPLLLGRRKDGGFCAASDLPALADCIGVYRMKEGETARCTAHGAQLYNAQGHPTPIAFAPPERTQQSADKGGYATYLEKEIAQQPEAAAHTIAQPFPPISRPSRVVLVGCGSAYHAALFGASLLQRQLQIPCMAALASEFRYDHIPIDRDTLAVCISQSGETADTLSSLRLAREQGAQTLSIVNTPGSSMTAEGGEVFLTRAGQEISVATTKAYCAQLTAMLRLCGVLDPAFCPDYAALPPLIARTIRLDRQTHALARKYHAHQSAYFIGRGLDLVTAMEGALKLRELCAVDAHAYAAGELKHGTLSLIRSGTLCVAVCCDAERADKTISNMEEVRSRGGEVLCVTTGSLAARLPDVETIVIPDAPAAFLPILSVIPLQFFAKSCAFFRKCNVDQPRNLAKSVTVE